MARVADHGPGPAPRSSKRLGIVCFLLISLVVARAGIIGAQTREAYVVPRDEFLLKLDLGKPEL